MQRRPFRSQQAGFFLLIAVVFILVMGVMGTMIAYLLSSRANVSVAEQQGLNAFYNAESGLEASARLLSIPALTGTPSRISCASVTGTSAITNASLNGGTFTVTTVNSSPVFATTTLSGAETASDSVINLTSASGFAPSGRVVIDGEAIDYTAISGNTLIGVTRGMDSTTASAHASGAGVGQYQCSLDSQAGIPSIASPSYRRELQWDVQLQDGWVVGNLSSSNFVLTRWNRPTEKSWTVSTLAGGSNVANLNSVSMLSYASGWAVGNAANRNINFLRWNGSSWSLAAINNTCSSANLQHLLDVSMVSAQQGFAVGASYRVGNATCSNGNYRYLITYWNGTTWTVLTPSSASPKSPADGNSSANNTPNLNAVHVIDTDGDGLANIGFAVGNRGVILQYNGTDWVVSSAPAVLTTQNLTGVYTVSASEAWAVGVGGLIYKWNGSTWSSFSSPTVTQLNEVAMLDTNGDGLADFGVGVGSSGRIITYNGSSWSSTSSGSANLFGVGIVSTNDVWVVGASGTAIHYDGSTWTSVASGTAVQLNCISLVASKKNPTSAWRQVFH